MIGIYAFGHGGGVPGPIPGTPVTASGNTNFAIIPNLSLKEVTDLARTMRGVLPGLPEGIMALGHALTTGPIAELLAKKPYWLIDCGPETALELCGVSVNGSLSLAVSQNCKGIFLTHCHDDHAGGIKSLGYRFKYIDKIKPHLYVPQEMLPLIEKITAEMLYHNPTVTDRSLGSYYDVKTYDSCEITRNLRLRSFDVDHNCFGPNGERFPAFGYEMTTPSEKTIVFSGDTARPLAEGVIRNADLVIHDVQFYNDGAENNHVHCPFAQLDAVVATPETAKRVLLTHTAHDLPLMACHYQLLRGRTLLVIE